MRKRSLNLITTERADLFQIMRTLVRTIPASLLALKNRPVLIFVNGSHSAGKKILPDAAIEEMFGFTPKFKAFWQTAGRKFLGWNPRFHGRKEFDEYWRGRAGGRNLEIDFINAAWSGHYSSDIDTSQDEQKIESFLQKRKYPGITFIHNNFSLIHRADMRIVLLDKDDRGELNELKRNRDAYAEAFNRLVPASKFTRFLNVEVRGSRLLNDRGFSSALDRLDIRKIDLPAAVAASNELSRRVRQIAEKLDPHTQRHAAIYGFNVPALE